MANILTSPVTGGLFICLAVIQLLAAFIIIYAGGTFVSDLLDNYIASPDRMLVERVALLTVIGASNWMFIFIFLAVTCFNLRGRLPVMPVFDEKISASETANCYSCGGAVEYDKNDFACICSYCHVKNFRAQFARLKRTQTEEQIAETDFALIMSTDIIERIFITIWRIVSIFFGFPSLLVSCALMNYSTAAGSYIWAVVCALMLGIMFSMAGVNASKEGYRERRLRKKNRRAHARRHS